MKKTILLFFCLLSYTLYAQQKPSELDKSPMDMSYWPNAYPLQKMVGKVKDQPIARLIYSRPQKNNRIIFDGIVKFNEIWRLGANEATELELFKNVKLDGKSLSKGRYTLYCLPNADRWTIIFSKDNFSWGSFSYDPKKDVYKTNIKLDKNTEVIEALTMYFEETKTGANLIMMWDDVKAVLPFNL